MQGWRECVARDHPINISLNALDQDARRGN